MKISMKGQTVQKKARKKANQF